MVCCVHTKRHPKNKQGLPKLHGVANLVLNIKNTTVFEKACGTVEEVVDIFMVYKTCMGQPPPPSNSHNISRAASFRKVETGD
jgi:hypothetical protein